MYTDDIDKHIAEQEKWLESLPVCENCHRHIQDESYHIIPKFGNVCDECLRDDFFVWNW